VLKGLFGCFFELELVAVIVAVAVVVVVLAVVELGRGWVAAGEHFSTFRAFGRRFYPKQLTNRQVKSNQFYLYSPWSQYSLKGLYTADYYGPFVEGETAIHRCGT